MANSKNSKTTKKADGGRGRSVKKVDMVKIESLEDLVNLNLNTLEKVVSGEIDNRRAQLIFTGSRTVTSSLKVGIEAMKLGMKTLGGIVLHQGEGQKRIGKAQTQ